MAAKLPDQMARCGTTSEDECPAHAAVSHMLFVLGGLAVNTDRMRDKVDMTQGPVMAEAVMMALAKKIGRRSAQAMASAAYDAAIASNSHLRNALTAEARITAAMRPQEIEAALDPADYLGETLRTIMARAYSWRTSMPRMPRSIQAFSAWSIDTP